MGMFLSLASLVNGDVSKLRTEFKPEPPFIQIDTAALNDAGTKMYEGFVKYALALADVMKS